MALGPRKAANFPPPATCTVEEEVPAAVAGSTSSSSSCEFAIPRFLLPPPEGMWDIRLWPFSLISDTLFHTSSSTSGTALGAISPSRAEMCVPCSF